MNHDAEIGYGDLTSELVRWWVIYRIVQLSFFPRFLSFGIYLHILTHVTDI